MLIVKVEDSIESAIKKLKRKFNSIKIGKQLRERKEYKKNSIKRRETIKKAIYLQKKWDSIKE